jgi:hypothetical protein
MKLGPADEDTPHPLLSFYQLNIFLVVLRRFKGASIEHVTRCEDWDGHRAVEPPGRCSMLHALVADPGLDVRGAHLLLRMRSGVQFVKVSDVCYIVRYFFKASVGSLRSICAFVLPAPYSFPGLPELLSLWLSFHASRIRSFSSSMSRFMVGTEETIAAQFTHHRTLSYLWECEWKFKCQRRMSPFNEGALVSDFSPIFDRLIKVSLMPRSKDSS